MSSISVNTITDASGGATTSINGFTPSVSNMAGRNRLINSDMRIDQRNAGASVTPASGNYTLDRWVCYLTQSSKFSVQQNAGSVTPPAGFVNYLGITSLSSYSVTSSDEFNVNQLIEGLNWADLGWGTANAKTVTLSFWVRSSLTGSFGGVFRNNAGNRSYPFTYTISSANTWEQKSITVAGDTSGTWLTTNSTGVVVSFSLGAGSTNSGTAGAWAGSFLAQPTGSTSVVGTSGATFYITGVQLEEGSVATPFEHRQYGQELALCQRYYQRTKRTGSATTCIGNGNIYNSTTAYSVYNFKQTMRSAPTGNSSASSDLGILSAGANYVSSNTSFQAANEDQIEIVLSGFSGAPTGNGGWIRLQTDNAWIDFSAEL